ncbi:MAG: hypothetical protein PHV30_08280, partial [Candidatus Margulisbacteria bacterium]|nr:hypothetical protein [Candidatus Margulisiibacteriota bacterium]
KETETIKLMPWLSVVKHDNSIEIVKNIQDTGGEFQKNFGNASAADADLDLLTALIMGLQKGWGDSNLKNFIYLYAKDFIYQVMKTYSINVDGTPQNFFLMSKGAFIAAEQDENGYIWNSFYPSYPNYKYLQYIAEYFKNDSCTSNSQGSEFMHKQFNKLLSDTKHLMAAVKDKYDISSDKAKVFTLPEHMKISVRDNKEIVIKDASAHNEMDNYRLYWRTGDQDFEACDGKLDNKCKLLEKNKNSYLYYLSNIKHLSPDDVPLKYHFHFTDVQENDNSGWEFWNNFVKHWSYTPDQANKYKEKDEFKEQDIASHPAELAVFYEIVPQDKLTVMTHYMYGVELSKSKMSVEKSVKLFEDTLTKLIDRDEINYESTFLSYIGAYYSVDVINRIANMFSGNKILANIPEKLSNKLMDINNNTNNIEIISYFIQTLRVMKGLPNKEIKKALNRIIASAKDKTNVKNSVLKALYMEKILLWDVLDPQERSQLKQVALIYKKAGIEDLNDLIGLFDSRFKDPESVYHYKPFNVVLRRYNYIPLSLTLGDIHINSDAFKTPVSEKDFAVINKFAPNEVKDALIKAGYIDKQLFVLRKSLVDKKLQDLDPKFNEIKGQIGDILKKAIGNIDYKVKVHDVEAMSLSANLKEILAREIVKRDLVDLFSIDEKKDLYLKFQMYVAKLPELYVNFAISIALYSDDIPYEKKVNILKERLSMLTDVERKQNPKRYINNYLMLYQAYQVLLFKQHHNKLEEYEANSRYQFKEAEFNYNDWRYILDKLYFHNQILLAPDNLEFKFDTKNLSKTGKEQNLREEKELMELFKTKFNGTLFNNFKKLRPDYYADVITQSISLSFWTDYDIHKNNIKELSKNSLDFVRLSENMSSRFIEDNKNSWMEHYRFFALKIRMDIENLEKIKNKFGDSSELGMFINKDGEIKKEIFLTLAKENNLNLDELWQELVDKGYIVKAKNNFAGSISERFNPLEPSFKFTLDSKFRVIEKNVKNILERILYIERVDRFNPEQKLQEIEKNLKYTKQERIDDAYADLLFTEAVLRIYLIGDNKQITPDLFKGIRGVNPVDTWVELIKKGYLTYYNIENIKKYSFKQLFPDTSEEEKSEKSFRIFNELRVKGYIDDNGFITKKLIQCGFNPDIEGLNTFNKEIVQQILVNINKKVEVSSKFDTDKVLKLDKSYMQFEPDIKKVLITTTNIKRLQGIENDPIFKIKGIDGTFAFKHVSSYLEKLIQSYNDILMRNRNIKMNGVNNNG